MTIYNNLSKTKSVGYIPNTYSLLFESHFNVEPEYSKMCIRMYDQMNKQIKSVVTQV